MSEIRSPLSRIKKPRIEATAWCYTGSSELKQYSFAWTIENFIEKMETYKNKEVLESDTFQFEVEGVTTAWRLQCYPKGWQKEGEEENLGNIAIFLKPANTSALNRKVSFTIELVDEEGARVLTRNASTIFIDVGEIWGFPGIAKHDKLRDVEKKLLPQNSLTIFCVLKFSEPDVTTSGTFRSTSTLPLDENMEQEEANLGMLELFKTGNLSDVEVVCQERTFSCHMSILASKSPVFMAAFSHNMKEKNTGKFEIENIEADTIEDVLTYIYGGKIDGLEDKAGKLLIAADQYDLKHLKKRCERFLAGSLTIDNCLDYLILADNYSEKLLKPMVMNFVARNSREVVTHDNWRKKLSSFPDLLADVLSELATRLHQKKQD